MGLECFGFEFVNLGCVSLGLVDLEFVERVSLLVDTYELTNFEFFKVAYFGEKKRYLSKLNGI